jgi:hypothetical protein
LPRSVDTADPTAAVELMRVAAVLERRFGKQIEVRLGMGQVENNQIL